MVFLSPGIQLFIPDVGGQGQRKSGQLCLVLVSLTADSLFSKNPDRIRTADRIFRKIRTKTRHGQDMDSAVRRRLIHTGKIINFKAFHPVV